MKSDRPALATQNKLPNSIRCWPLADKFISTKKHKLLSSWSPRFHFLKHCTWENAFDTSVLGISHTACLRAKALRRNSHQCYMSPRTQSAFSFFEALRMRERFWHKCFRYITHCMSACKSFAAQFSSMLHVTTDSLAGWKLCLLSITTGETLSPLVSFNGHLLFLSGGRISSSETVKILFI